MSASQCGCREKTCACYRLGFRLGEKEGKFKARTEVRVEKEHQYQLATPADGLRTKRKKAQ